MRAVFIEAFDADDPTAAVRVGERPAPEPPDGWTLVDVKAAALNHHDVWSARGQGLGESQLPMILGCDAAGTDPDGNPVIVHSVITSPGGAVPRSSTRGCHSCPSVIRARSPSKSPCRSATSSPGRTS